MNRIHYTLFYYFLSVFTLMCSAHTLSSPIAINTRRPCISRKEKVPVTIFVHGTLFPLIDVVIHTFDVPLGLTPALVQGNKFYMGKIPFILHQSCPEQFPLETFYLFGWSGKLCFRARKNAAHDLYSTIKKFVGHPITLIAHSHGGNVVLNLPAVAYEQGDTLFSIDRLILLANPVQVVTSQFAASPVFKQVFSFYSRGDRTQTMDPQGLYRQWGKAASMQRLVFSQRTFIPSPNLIQIGTVIHKKRPGHLDFIAPRFLKHLPFMLTLFPLLAHDARIKNREQHFAIYLPRCSCQQYKYGHACEIAY